MDPIDTFSLSSTHIAFTVKPSHLNIALHTREDVYMLPLQLDSAAVRPSHLTAGSHGAISGVTFSPDGKRIAWLEMGEDGYESDKSVLVVHDLKGSTSSRWTQDWDRSPSSISVGFEPEPKLIFTSGHSTRHPCTSSLSSKGECCPTTLPMQTTSLLHCFSTGPSKP